MDDTELCARCQRPRISLEQPQAKSSGQPTTAPGTAGPVKSPRTPFRPPIMAGPMSGNFSQAAASLLVAIHARDLALCPAVPFDQFLSGSRRASGAVLAEGRP